MLAACVKTSAQPAPPPPPQVTVAQRHRARRDRVGRIHRPPSGRRLRRSPAARLRIRLRRPLLRRRHGAPGRPAVPDRPASVPGRGRSTARRARSRAAPPCSARTASSRAPTGCATRERDLERGARSPRARSRRNRPRRSRPSKRRCAPRSSNLEFTQVTSPIDGRVSRAIVTEGNLVSSGPGEATLLTTVVSLDPIYASFDADEQIFLQLQRPRQRQSGIAAPIDLPIRMALANEEGFPREGTLRLPRQPARSRDRHDPRPRGVPQHRRPADAGPVRAPAPAGHRRRTTACCSGPRRRHRPRARSSSTSSAPKHEIEYRAGDARADRRRPARRAQRSDGRRAGRRQRAAARPAGRQRRVDARRSTRRSAVEAASARTEGA